MRTCLKTFNKILQVGVGRSDMKKMMWLGKYTSSTAGTGNTSSTSRSRPLLITHSHGSARVFKRRRSKSMKKAKIRPLATPKPLNVAIGSAVSVPQIRDFAVLLGWLVCSLFGFFNKATAYTPGRIFTQNTSNDVVPGKGVPFGGPGDIFYIWTLKFPKNRHFGDRFWLDFFLRPKTTLTWGCSNIKLPLIVIVAAWKLYSE